MKSLTVLYDGGCNFCRRARDWLSHRTQLVPLRFVSAGSPEALGMFPDLDHTRTLCDLTVVSDEGEVYQGERAWLVCLWALAAFRGVAVRASASRNKVALRAAMSLANRLRDKDYGEHHDGTWPARCQVGG
ncbi:thiol-disulfide oxidoreductase DCC family protein [Actinocrispum wychmicini]|uniref:Uncharacterized protein DUF393 n=1 Tax=Actinocrispum wychmicini TaxID=1213861 RepID=A0A4R2J1P0_9PSEU|nr:DCC1-like thiol-disulfide oxidoreductase family protein [Actinocrispum wychmicini]TCO50756.1 uncharacterized protein DUF393 [Actinocrispum wychmicini]